MKPSLRTVAEGVVSRRLNISGNSSFRELTQRQFHNLPPWTRNGRKGRIEGRQKIQMGPKTKMKRMSVFNAKSYVIDHETAQARWPPAGENGAGRDQVKSPLVLGLEGDFAAVYHKKTNRSGAFFGDRYHCTMVEDVSHLWNCILYTDLNMVRTGVVAHPADWDWCGYRELVGEKKRCRLLDVTRLLELLGMPDHQTFIEEYQ